LSVGLNVHHPVGDIAVNPYRRLDLWLALCLAIVLPVTALGQSYAGNPLARVGQLGPGNNQSPVQSPHEEDESHSPEKLETTKALGRRLRLVSLARRISVLPTVTESQARRHAAGVTHPHALPLPAPFFLDDALSHRGPPCA